MRDVRVKVAKIVYSFFVCGKPTVRPIVRSVPWTFCAFFADNRYEMGVLCDRTIKRIACIRRVCC